MNQPDTSGNIPPAVEKPVPFFKRIQPVTFAVVSLFAVFFLYQIVAGIAAFALFKGRVTDDNVSFVRWVTVIGQLLFILVPTVLLAKLRHPRAADFFRFHLPDPGEIVVTVVGVFALQQMLQGYLVLQESIPLPPVLRHYVDVVKTMFEETTRILVSAHSPTEFLLVVLMVALVPAIAEELLFRGLVQRSLEEAVGGLRGAIITGVIFGAYHLNPFSIVPLVALGVYFGFIAYRSGTITLAMSAHFFNNFIACTAVYLELNDDFVAIAPEGHVSNTVQLVNFAVFSLVFVASTYYFIRMTDRTEDE
jgi:membrane protease YdiL (CAAX protease family)